MKSNGEQVLAGMNLAFRYLNTKFAKLRTQLIIVALR